MSTTVPTHVALAAAPQQPAATVAAPGLQGPLSPADLRMIVGSLMSTPDPWAATTRLIELMHQERDRKLAAAAS